MVDKTELLFVERRRKERRRQVLFSLAQTQSTFEMNEAKIMRVDRVRAWIYVHVGLTDDRLKPPDFIANNHKMYVWIKVVL